MKTPDAPSTPTAADDLRHRFITALDRAADQPSATRPGLYDVMLAAVQPELAALRAQVAHQGAYITSQGDALAAMERDRDRLAAVLAVLAAPSPLRVRSAGVRMTHEAVRTRLGVLLPACGTSLRGATSAPAGSPVTCPFCNGTEKPIAKENP